MTFSIPAGFVPDACNVADGNTLLQAVTDVPLVIFDPQYRAGLDKLSYGNEGERQSGRAEQVQQSERQIYDMLHWIHLALRPSGHLFMWMDKFNLINSARDYGLNTGLELVDMVTWDKMRIGMGYRTRRQSEHLVIYQKVPKRAKGVWTDHSIPDIIAEKVYTEHHPHTKPSNLQARLICAVTAPGEFVVDPCAGGYSSMRAAHSAGRRFLGCSL